MDLSVSPKDEIWFMLVCHHISNAVHHFVLNFAHYGRIGALDVRGKGRIWYKTTDKCLWSTYDFKIYMISFVKLFLPLLVMTFLVYVKINMFIFWHYLSIFLLVFHICSVLCMCRSARILATFACETYVLSVILSLLLEAIKMGFLMP
jgi:hypothetical protein